MLADLQFKLETEGLPAAVELCRERVRIAPTHADAHRYLGQLHALAGEFPEAMRAAQRACELAPKDARCFSDLGRVHALQGRYAEASRSCEQAVQIDPGYSDGWHNLGTALKQLGNAQGAFAALKKALLLDPARPDTYLNLGNLLIAADQFEDAVECFERAAAHDSNLAAARYRLARELSSRGRVQRAETLFRQSLALDPERTESWFGLGRTLEDLGQAEGALSCYLNVINRQPGHAPALGRYLALVSEEPELNTVNDAQAAMKSTDTPDETKALLGYGLLKFYDRRKQYADAASAGRIANAARRRDTGPLDRRALAARVDGIIRTYTRQFFDEHRRFGIGDDQAVFIVGLPRSGTTLTEQILSAHGRLHGAGELPDLARIAARCVSQGAEAWQAAAHLDETQSPVRAEEYLKALRDGAPAGQLRISDKSPLNFFHLAFAAVLLPNSRVVHCVREARDNALSIWMENFSPDQRYATDFEDLAFYRAQYERLMAHWRNHLPLPMIEMRYERSVLELETQARKLIHFLDAPWDSRCLNFHESTRAVQTLSRWQVRQPIYSSSVERWRRYRPYLRQLEAAFRIFRGGVRQSWSR